MSTNKHVEEVINPWATFLADADDNQDGFITDHTYSMALLDGTNYYEWQPNRYWNGAAWTYYDVGYNDITAYGDLTVGDDAWITGDVGVGTTCPSAYLDIEKTGTAKGVTDFLELTNKYNAADMVGTGTGILFRQWYYDAVTPAVADAARISYVTNYDWTSTATTRDGYLSTSLVNDGVMFEMFRITSDQTKKSFTLYTDSDIWDDANERAAMDMAAYEYCHFGVTSATAGGLHVVGAADGNVGITLEALSTTEATNLCRMKFNAYVHDGAGAAVAFADTSQVYGWYNGGLLRNVFYGDGSFEQHDPDCSHGMTDYLPTTAYSRFSPCDAAHPGYGGLRIIGASDCQCPGIQLYGIRSINCASTDYIRLVAGVISGTGITEIGDSEYVLRVINGTTQTLGIYGDGDMVIGSGAAGHDYVQTWNGETNVGTITFREDENRFDFNNDVHVTNALGVGPAMAPTVAGRIQCSETVYSASGFSCGDNNAYLNTTRMSIDATDIPNIRAQYFGDIADSCGTIEMAHQRGTIAIPTAIQAGDVLGKLNFIGFDTNRSIGAQIRGVAAADWGTSGDTTDDPTDLIFATCPDGSGSLVDRMTIAAAGDIYSTAFTDYSGTSTIVGMGTPTTKEIYYKVIGKLCWCWFYIATASGASGTAVSFTLPAACARSASYGSDESTAFMYSAHGTSSQVSRGKISTSNVITLLYDIVNNDWAGASRIVRGSFCYEIA